MPQQVPADAGEPMVAAGVEPGKVAPQLLDRSAPSVGDRRLEYVQPQQPPPPMLPGRQLIGGPQQAGWGWTLVLNPDGTTTAWNKDKTKILHSHSPPARAG